MAEASETKELVLDLFNQNKLDEARTALDAALAPPAWIAYMRGRIAWKEGKKATAIGYYNQAIALDPCSEAATALEQALRVMDFYNKDLYNP